MVDAKKSGFNQFLWQLRMSHVVLNDIKPEIWPRKSEIRPSFNWLMTAEVSEEFGACILRLQVVHEECPEEGSRKLLRDVGTRLPIGTASCPIRLEY